MISPQSIYFDHNATTAPSPEVLYAMMQTYQFAYNSSAIHHLGSRANKQINDARSAIQKALNAYNYDVVFTSGATEATNMLFFGINNITDIIISNIEHVAVYNCRPPHRNITEIKCNSDSLIDLQQVSLPNHANFLLSAMLVNNETGSIQPIKELAQLVHQKSGLIHCDIAQAVGKINVDLESLNVDFASLSAHKFNGPQGIGALLIRKGLDINPFILGGKQEKGKRAGTVNVAGAVGFGIAILQAQQNLSEFAKLANLQQYLEQKLLNIFGKDVYIFAQNTARVSNTTLFSLKKQHSQTVVINCDINNICISAGAACSSGAINQSRILNAINADPDFIVGAVRVSLGINNTIAEIDYFLDVLNNFYLRSNNQ